jgi:PAS domain S-box-containing protein
MPYHRQITRWFWPSSLAWQLALPVISLLFAFALYTWMSINSLADERRDEVVEKLTHLSESFQYLPRSGRATPGQDMERFLLLAAAKPVQRICIYNNGGNGRLCAQRPKHGQTYLNTDAPTPDTPSVYAPTLLTSDESVTYWWPMDNAGHASAWLMISASLQAINQWRSETLMTAFTWFAVFCAAGLLTFIMVVRQSVKKISISAQFAEELTSRPNQELVQHCMSTELNRLVNALNRISKHWHHRLQLSEQANTHLRMHKVAIDLHSAVCITNGAGRIEYANNHFCIASGYAEPELQGKKISILNSGYHDEHFFKNLWRTLALGRVWHGELCNRNKRGETYWVQCTIAPIKDHLGRPCQYITIQTMLSKPQQMGVPATVKG